MLQASEELAEVLCFQLLACSILQPVLLPWLLQLPAALLTAEAPVEPARTNSFFGTNVTIILLKLPR